MYVLFWVFCFIVLFCVLFVCKMCTVLLPSGVNPIAVNKYNVSHQVRNFIMAYITYLQPDDIRLKKVKHIALFNT